MSTGFNPAVTAPVVDNRALQTNQVFIVGSVIIGFLIGTPGGAVIVALVALSLAIGAARAGSGPFQQFYRRILRPSGVVQPDVHPGEVAPHRFAQALGASFLVASSLALFTGVDVLGWALAWIVVGLALVNLLFGFCAGCFVFFQIRRLRKSGGDA